MCRTKQWNSILYEKSAQFPSLSWNPPVLQMHRKHSSDIDIVGSYLLRAILPLLLLLYECSINYIIYIIIWKRLIWGFNFDQQSEFWCFETWPDRPISHPERNLTTSLFFLIPDLTHDSYGLGWVWYSVLFILKLETYYPYCMKDQQITFWLLLLFSSILTS